MNWKIIVPLTLLVLVLTFLIATQFGGKKPSVTGPTQIGQQPSAKEYPEEPSFKLPIATGDIDEATNSFLMDSLEEKSQLVKALDEDVAIVDLDREAINDFAQVYNENDF